MKSKPFRITIDLILIILGIVFLVFGIKDAISTFSTPTLEDNVKFSKSYTNVPIDNIFKYIESLDKVNGQNAIIFIGNPYDVWSQVITPVLYEMIKDKYDVIYYYEQKDDVPQIIIIDDTVKQVYKKDDLIEKEYKDAPIEYFTEENKNKLSNILLK